MDARSIAIVVCALLVPLALLRARGWLRSWRARARGRRAREGERTGRALLERRGFEIVAEQVPGAIVLRVDGRESVHDLRADFLVERGGRRFVAEVKTGALAPSLDHAPTRRQILEYCAAFEVDGALLVDAEAGRVREIALPIRLARGARPSWLLVLALGVALGVLLAVALR